MKRQVINRHNAVKHRAKHRVIRRRHQEVSLQEAHLRQLQAIMVEKADAVEIDNQCFINDFDAIIV